MRHLQTLASPPPPSRLVLAVHMGQMAALSNTTPAAPSDMLSRRGCKLQWLPSRQLWTCLAVRERQQSLHFSGRPIPCSQCSLQQRGLGLCSVQPLEVSTVHRPYLQSRGPETPLVLHIGNSTWDYTPHLGPLPGRAADRCSPALAATIPPAALPALQAQLSHTLRPHLSARRSLHQPHGARQAGVVSLPPALTSQVTVQSPGVHRLRRYLCLGQPHGS